MHLSSEIEPLPAADPGQRRLRAILRRIRASEPVAQLIVELAFGRGSHDRAADCVFDTDEGKRR